MMIAAGCALNGRSGHDAGRELLGLLYFKETGKSLPEIRITNRGKPYFPNSPLHFSITHTDSYAFCVLSDHPVGIDAEELNRRFLPSLIPKVLSPFEWEQYESSADQRRAFLTLWVLKEAAVKLTGEGLRGYPNQTNFSLEDPRVHLWLNCLVALIGDTPDEGVQFHAF